MKKEDYMNLPKERLAELLEEREPNSEEGVYITRKYILEQVAKIDELLDDKKFVSEMGKEIEYYKGKKSVYGELAGLICINNNSKFNKKEKDELLSKVDSIIKKYQK